MATRLSQLGSREPGATHATSNAAMRHLRWYSAISTVLFVLSLTVLVDTATPAFASCAAPVAVEQALADSDLVFVGTVVGLTNERRWATFKVDELWKGTPGSRQVEVRAGPEDPAGPNQAASSVDRRYGAGGRYLVFARDPRAHDFSPIWGPGSRFEDNNCSATQPYVAALGRYRPVTTQPLPAAAPPKAAARSLPDADNAAWGLILLLLGVPIAGLAGVTIVRRRVRASRSPV